MAGILSLVGPAIGAGSALFGLANNNTPSPGQVQLPPSWQAPGMTDTANNTLGLIGSSLSNNIPANILPLYQQIVSSLMNNPGASGAMQGANMAQGYGANAANNAFNSGNALGSMGPSAMPNVSALFQQGMDPQRELYGRTLHDVTEQTRAGLEARGLNSTPYGAGVEGKTLSNFNIDWNNSQLGRMATAAQGAGGLMNNIGGAVTGGTNLMNMAPGMAQSAGMYPYTTFNQIGGDQLAGLNALSQAGITANSIPNTGIQQYLQYLGMGNQAGGVANQTGQLGLNQAQMGFQQNQILGNQLGQSLTGFGNAWGKAGGMNGIGAMFGSGPSGAINPSVAGGGYLGTGGNVYPGPGA